MCTKHVAVSNHVWVYSWHTWGTYWFSYLAVMVSDIWCSKMDIKWQKSGASSRPENDIFWFLKSLQKRKLLALVVTLWYIWLWPPNICQLVALFGCIDDIGQGSVRPLVCELHASTFCRYSFFGETGKTCKKHDPDITRRWQRAAKGWWPHLKNVGHIVVGELWPIPLFFLSYAWVLSIPRRNRS